MYKLTRREIFLQKLISCRDGTEKIWKQDRDENTRRLPYYHGKMAEKKDKKTTLHLLHYTFCCTNYVPFIVLVIIINGKCKKTRQKMLWRAINNSIKTNKLTKSHLGWTHYPVILSHMQSSPSG